MSALNKERSFCQIFTSCCVIEWYRGRANPTSEITQPKDHFRTRSSTISSKYIIWPTWAWAVGCAADGDCEVPGEEGQPAEEEGAEHDAQRHEGLVLLPPRRVDAVPLTQP